MHPRNLLYDIEKGAGFEPNQYREWYYGYRSHYVADSQIKRRLLRKISIDELVRYWYLDILGNTHIPRKQIDFITQDMIKLQHIMQYLLNTVKTKKTIRLRRGYTTTDKQIKQITKVGKRTGWWDTIASKRETREIFGREEFFWVIDLKINKNKFLTKKDLRYHCRIFLAIKNTFGKDISGIIMKIMLKNNFISYPIVSN